MPSTLQSSAPTSARAGAPGARRSASPRPAGRLDRVRMRPGLEALWRSTGELQLGTAASIAIRLEGLTAPETRWLAACAGTDRLLVPAAARHGIDRRRARELIALLDAAGTLLPVRASDAHVTATSGGGADKGALSVVHAARDAAAILERRAQQTAVITSAGRTGSAIALALAVAGVGTLAVHDDRPVQAVDVGPGAFRLRDVGLRRDQATAEQIAGAAPAARVRVMGDGEIRSAVLRADVVIQISDRAPDVAGASRLIAAGIDHLAVVVGEAGTDVGPLVVPGETTCLRCVELHRRDTDDRWPTMAVQLRQRYSGSPAPQETATAGVAAAVATAQTLAHLDGHRSRLRGATLEIDLPQALPRLRERAPHPKCGCGAQNAEQVLGSVP